MLTFVTSLKTDDTDFFGHEFFMDLDFLDGEGTGAGFSATIGRFGLAAPEMGDIGEI